MVPHLPILHLLVGVFIVGGGFIMGFDQSNLAVTQWSFSTSMNCLYWIKLVDTWQYFLFYLLFFPYDLGKRIFLHSTDTWFCLKVGSIEGRVGVHHIDDSQQSKNFTFKCHREGNDIFSVNSLNFHPVRSLSCSLLTPYFCVPFLYFISPLLLLWKMLMETSVEL